MLFQIVLVRGIHLMRCPFCFVVVKRSNIFLNLFAQNDLVNGE